MRAVIQRVSEARVTVAGAVTGEIGRGLLVLLGVGQEDDEHDARLMVEKVAQLRCFADEDSKFNRSVEDNGGGVLVVSQFTLYGDCRKGRRPSFSDAARPETAVTLYESVARHFEARGLPTARGVFGAHMDVQLVNDGPVTLLIDTKRVF